MKKILNIIMIIVILFSLTGCGTKEEVKNKETDAKKFKEEYEKLNGKKRENDDKTIRTVSIDEDNPIIYTTAEEVVKKMENKETFVVYFGFAACPWCRSMIEQLLKSAKDNNQDKLYYVDVLEIRDKFELTEEGNLEKTEPGSEGYNKLIDLMKDVLSDYNINDSEGNTISTEEKRIYAPNVVAVVNGKAEKMIEGTSSKLEDPYQELTEEMKEESYNSIKCIWECLSNTPVCKQNAC